MKRRDNGAMRALLPVFVIVLVDLLGLTIIVPLLPLYAASFGASPFVIGLLGAAYPVMQVIGAPLLGRLSDQVGRKPVLIVSQLGTLIGFVLMGLASSLPLLFLARLIDGFSGANIATAQAVITDKTDERNRTQGLALIGAAFGIGFTIGPVVAFVALALAGNDYRAPAFLAAGFSLLSLLLTTFWLKESLPREARAGASQGRPALSRQALFQALRHPRHYQARRARRSGWDARRLCLAGERGQRIGSADLGGVLSDPGRDVAVPARRTGAHRAVCVGCAAHH